ncbi:hypothetical protein ACN08N_25525 (plasmid) [Photobacterium leiognathi subsp. mandapamensis]
MSSKMKKKKGARSNKNFMKRHHAAKRTHAFVTPNDYYFGCHDELVGKYEASSLDALTFGVHLPNTIYIFPANGQLITAMDYRLELKECAPINFKNAKWVVYSSVNELPLAAFVELDLAKTFVFENFPDIKKIRTNSLGLLPGQPDYSTLPDAMKSGTKGEWIQYCCTLEDNYGILFDPIDLAESLVLLLIKDYDAPKAWLDEIGQSEDLSHLLEFTVEKELTAFQYAFEVINEFNGEYSRIEAFL